MQIAGLMKTTLLDYPQHVASTIFTAGCNFRCPYCHNGDLVTNVSSLSLLDIDEIFEHLEKRKNIIDGVCITGGEPTLQKDLYDFISDVRTLDLKVKLDTNGSNPDVLKKLLSDNMLDYVAIDIKTSREKYNTVACGMKDYSDAVDESRDILMNSSTDYEFRTTVARELITYEDFLCIARWINGAKAYFLQPYRESKQVLQKGFNTYSAEEFEEILNIIKPYVANVCVRAMD